MAPRIKPQRPPYHPVRKHLPHPSRHPFTTSPTTTAPQATTTTTRIPPSSPNFIPIPQPLQPQQIHPKWMKGVLPVPRPLFPRSAPDKSSPQYLASTTPEPLPRNLNRPRADLRAADLARWKSRQSELRRENLRQSLIELKFRKEGTDHVIAARSARTQSINRARREAPEREDERLTSATVLQADMVQRRRHSGGLPDPGREARLANKRQNLASHNQRAVQKRREMLHKLYIHAGSFITTAKQLDRVVERAFDDLTQFSNDAMAGSNIWNTGEPQTTRDLLGMRTRGDTRGRRALDDVGRKKVLGEERLRVVGEELTGGRT